VGRRGGDDGLDALKLETHRRGAKPSRLSNNTALADRARHSAGGLQQDDYEKAVEPFEKHPEMVLRMKDIVSFKANWQPKSENIRQIAADLNLGLDSFVFIDDIRRRSKSSASFCPKWKRFC